MATPMRASRRELLFLHLPSSVLNTSTAFTGLWSSPTPPTTRTCLPRTATAAPARGVGMGARLIHRSPYERRGEEVTITGLSIDHPMRREEITITGISIDHPMRREEITITGLSINPPMRGEEITITGLSIDHPMRREAITITGLSINHLMRREERRSL
ncbi:hypothetical protein NHX12_031065 [Muraenolepis orangiensis]|uniref:Uncharacterized protein n=1 Tax=Muraenolepis orangiensis TaxID=630683 RepID=A0A9Q0EBH4_9TELE|nr:hypothetical protein NHX12_031065 [Muraenolepis orangiensis]